MQIAQSISSFLKKWRLSVNVDGRGRDSQFEFAIVCEEDSVTVDSIHVRFRSDRNDRCGENWSNDVVEQFSSGKTLRFPESEMAA